MVAAAVGKEGAESPLGIPWGRAQTLKVDVAPLAAATERLKSQVDGGRLPGFLSCVIKEGQLLHFEAYGHADVAAGTPLTADTLFRLYSQTKPLVLVAFLILLERGVVSLDDPVSKYIPGFQQAVVGEKRKPILRPIAVRDLVAHTSGVGFGPGFHYVAENDYEKTYVDLVSRVDKKEIQSLAEWCDEVAKLPLRFQPGKDWGYGYSSDILGRVIEVAGGRPLDEFLEAEVIAPLGMKDTFFTVPMEKVHRLSALYKREPWDGSGKQRVRFVTADAGGSGVTEDISKSVYCKPSEPDDLAASAPSSSVFLMGGQAGQVIQGGGCVCSIAGGLVSNLRDYARFSQMIVNGGEINGLRVLKPESVKLLARDWLNDFTLEKRRKPLFVWGTPGIGFSPLGQIGIEAKDAKRTVVGSQLDTVHWGGAGGSGYMLSWPHKLVVLTYTGCALDTATQKLLWKAAFSAIRLGRAKPVAAGARVKKPRPAVPKAAVKKQKRPQPKAAVSKRAGVKKSKK